MSHGFKVFPISLNTTFDLINCSDRNFHSKRSFKTDIVVIVLQAK